MEQQEQQQARPSLTPWDDQSPTPRGQLLVMTQRGIPSVRQEVPDSPCPACGGSGKVTCGNCRRGGPGWGGAQRACGERGALRGGACISCIGADSRCMHRRWTKCQSPC